MSDTKQPDAIVVDHLSKAYGPRWVVKDLNLKVPSGCVYGFLGRNGAGKSTTIKMLTGMVRPDSGTVSLLGEEIASITPATRARIAYMAEGHPLYSWMTVGQIVKFTRAFYANWDQTLVDQVLDHFELSRKQKCGTLSKGQQTQIFDQLPVVERDLPPSRRAEAGVSPTVMAKQAGPVGQGNDARVVQIVKVRRGRAETPNPMPNVREAAAVEVVVAQDEIDRAAEA